MSSTFAVTGYGAVSFMATTESWSEQSNSDTSILGFPGGDAVAISLAGQRETLRSFKALFNNATDYQTFASMRNKAGTIYVELWDMVPRNAVLQRCSPDPILIDGKVLALVAFVLY